MFDLYNELINMHHEVPLIHQKDSGNAGVL